MGSVRAGMRAEGRLERSAGFRVALAKRSFCRLGVISRYRGFSVVL